MLNSEQVFYFIDALEGIKSHIAKAPVLLETDIINKIGSVQEAMHRVSTAQKISTANTGEG